MDQVSTFTSRVARWAVFTSNRACFCHRFAGFFCSVGVRFWAGFRILTFLQNFDSKSDKLRLLETYKKKTNV